MKELVFEWDKKKEKANVQKHGVSFEDARPPFTDAIPFAKALIAIAPERVLCGTDWPHPDIKEHMPNDGNLVDLIPLMAETAELQQKLLVDNPHRLYGFGN